MQATSFDNYIIRPMQQGDVPRYFKLIEANRPRLENYFSTTARKTRTLADAEDFVAVNIKRREEKEYYPFVVIDTTKQNIIGYVDVKSIDWRLPRGEFGCFISPDHMGKGVAKKAMTIVIDHFFNELGFNKLFLRTHENNRSARALAEACGFEVEGHLRGDHKTNSGEILDMVYYGLLKK